MLYQRIKLKPVAIVPTPLESRVEFVDLWPSEQNLPIRFTFFWPKDNRWEGRDYTIEVRARTTARGRKETYGEIADRVA